MDLQQKSWLSEVRTDVRTETLAAFSDGAGSGKRLMSPGPEDPSAKTLSRQTFAGRAPSTKCQMLLPLGGAASQLLHFALLRSARVVPRLQRILSFALLARGAFQFLAFVFGQLCCVCHESDSFPLNKFSAVPTGLGNFFVRLHPALKRWAIIGRPSGAVITGC
jgi:hypothetical protein